MGPGTLPLPGPPPLGDLPTDRRVELGDERSRPEATNLTLNGRVDRAIWRPYGGGRILEGA